MLAHDAAEGNHAFALADAWPDIESAVTLRVQLLALRQLAAR